MSTVVVVRKNGVATIAADSLVKYGDTDENAKYIANFSKLIEIGNGYLAFVGHASFGLVVSSYLSSLEEPPQLNSREEIFEFSRQMHSALKKEYFIGTHEDDDDTFESSQLECLIANPSGIYGLYSLRLVQEYHRFYAFGSGAEFALGAMHAAWETTDDPEQIAMAGLQASDDFDDGTAGPFTLERIPLS